MLRVLSPITPHVTQHLWSALGFGESILDAAWPEPDSAALEQQELDLVLQINGKLRGSVRVPADADQSAIEKLALMSHVAMKHVASQAVKKVVVVPGRLVNIVL